MRVLQSLSLRLSQALLTALAANGGSRDVHSAIEAALPVLLERLADNNARLRDSARDALVALAQVRVCILYAAHSSSAHFLHSGTAAVHTFCSGSTYFLHSGSNTQWQRILSAAAAV
jgi:hypothetical protein